jgi:PAS domain-containing protein
MTLFNRLSADELEIRVQELTAELEKVNQKQEENTHRYNRILEGINGILSNVMQAKTEGEMANACLSVALELTGSLIGFVGLMDDDGLLHDIAINGMGWEMCLMYDKIGHRRPPGNLVVHGLYGSVINNGKGFFTNKPLSHPDSIGLPFGHPPINSFLGVPLVLDGKTMGVIAVADREGGYSYEHQEDLEAILPAVMHTLHSNMSEEALSEAYEDLKVHSEELHVSIEELRAQSEELHKANELLHESEKRYRTLAENSPDVIARFDRQKRYIYANPASEETYGWSLKEIIGKTNDELMIDSE